MKKLLIIVCTFVFFVTSCKKKEFPENITEEPAFYISANIDGTPVSLQAGTFGYYMYSSYVQDTNGMYTFVAEVKPASCGSVCPNSLKIELNDNKMSALGGTCNINNSIKIADYEFANTATVAPTLVGYEAKFTSIYNKTNANTTYVWNFDDPGSVSFEANPTHTYNTAGIKNVNLGISETGTSPMMHIENPIKVTVSNLAVKTRILTPLVNGNTISFSNISSGGSGTPVVYSYKWNFGDQSPISTLPNPSHTYSVNGMYKVNLKVRDSANDSTEYNFNINTANSYSPATNFSVVTKPIYFTTATNLLSKVKITYVDAGGKIYCSNLQSQVGAGNAFSITSVEEYKTNENGQATKKLKIKFDCKLYTGTGNSVTLTNGEAVIAVSYK